MSQTYIPIATTTTTTSQTSITFSNITGIYTDLVLVSSALATTASTNLMFRFNSDTSTNYSAILLKGNGSSASAFRYSNGNDGRIGEFGSANLGTYITHFQNYSNSTTHKTVLSRSNVASDHASVWVSLWRSTSPISLISIIADNANIVSGATFSLYGIKAE